MSAVLTEVDTVEVSLVDRGANMKRFALRKQQRKANMSKTTVTKAQRETIVKALKALAKKTFVQVDKALADVTPEGRKAIMAAIGLLANAKADLPDGLLQDVMTAAGIETPDDMVDLIAGDSAADAADGDMPDGDTPPAPGAGDPVLDSADSKPTTTPGENMPTQPAAPQNKDAEMYKSQIAKAQKDATDAAATATALKKQLDESSAKMVELEKAAALEKNLRLEKEFIAKAAKLAHLPVKAEDLGPVLKALADKAPEEVAKLEKFLQQTNEKLATTDALLKELGHSQPDGEGKTAMGELEKAASELRKADPKLTKEQAISKALLANPQLYDKHNEEQAAA